MDYYLPYCSRILSFIGSKEFKGLNWIHYPWDFLVIVIVALIFYQLGTTSYFESIYFKRANKLNKKMGDKLRKTRKKRVIKIGKNAIDKSKINKTTAYRI